jgi:hypothetical protein
MSLEDRLCKAQELVDQVLEDLAVLRAECNDFFNDILVLCNVGNNDLCLYLSCTSYNEICCT